MTKKTPLAVVILAAGKGTRMKSDKPKVMHTLLGLPMINWLLNTVEQLSPKEIVVVVGKDMPELEEAVQPHKTIIQKKQDGTGSAIKTGMQALEGFAGDVLVLLGDTPLISKETLKKLIDARHQGTDTGLSVLGAQFDNPAGYGRLLMDDDGHLTGIREEKDATEAEKQIKIVNTGAFCLDASRVGAWLEQLQNDNAQGEYYITDLPEIAGRDGVKTQVAVTTDTEEVQGCNTRVQLSELEARAQKQVRDGFLNDGVILEDPSSVYFHHDTKVGAGTRIEPNVYFGPGVTVDKNVHIKAFCHFEESHISKNTSIGPFARLRPGADVGEDVRIGNFVEIKKSQIGDRSKISHLAYVGDCMMAEDVNFSCGAITVNYDGFKKYQTIIGKGVMVGSNVNLVAPVILEDGAYVAAGSTITHDVPADALSVERGEITIKENWAVENRERKTTS